MTATLRRRITDAIASHRARAKAVGQTIDYGADDLQALVADALSKPCPYCRYPITETSFSVDHDTPTSRLGSFAMRNLVVCCKACNTKKSALTGQEFKDLMAMLRGWHPSAQTDILRRLMAGGGTWKRGKRK